VWLSAPAVRQQALQDMMHWVNAYALRPERIAGSV
jgi:hypothetical protein